MSNYFNKIIFNLNKEPIILNKNKTLFNQDDSVNGIYFVIEGLIKVTQVDRSNKIIFTRLTLPLDTVGHRSIFTQKTYLGTAEIISDTAKVLFISTDEIIKLMSTNVEFSRGLIVKISSELVRLESNRFKVKDKTSFERVAEFLVHIAENYSEVNSDGVYKFKSEIPKNVISSILFMADETVIRAMTDLKKDNVISYDGRIICVKNILKLKKLAKII